MAARVANAPSRENLPRLTRQPADRVLVMEPVGDCHANEQMTTELPAVEEVGAGAGFAPPPARCIYEARYACPSVEAVHVKVTEYPSADWAAYQIMNDRTPGSLTRSTRSGQTIYVDELEVFIWSSGNKLLALSGIQGREAVTEQVLKAYLAKYPSSNQLADSTR